MKFTDKFTDEELTEWSNELAREIDREIMDDIHGQGLIADGWTESKIKAPSWPFDRPTWATDTAEWCHKHCSGNYRLLNGKWYFKHPEDATMFALVWA